MSSARMCFVFFVSLTGLAAGAGCTAQSTTSGTDGSAGGDAAATVSPEAGSTSDGATNADGSAAPTTKPATCLAIFDCVAGCNSDQPCADACVQSAPPDAQTQAVALAQCSTDANCNDDACVQSQCSPSLDACVQGGMPAPGQPIDGSVPAGVVPPQLVGTWAYAAWGSSTTFTFNADGTGTYTFATTGDVTGCTSTSAETDKGNAVFADTSFTFYATEVDDSVFMCGVKSSMAQSPTEVVFDYTYDAQNDELDVIQQMGPGCPYSADADRSFYCRSPLKRQP
jgi:hypothetical protein